MIQRGTLIASVAVLLVLVAGFVILVDRGRDVSSYAIFVAGPLVSTIVGAVLTQRTARVEAVVKKVEHQTNSLLTARLDRIDVELNAAPLNRTQNPTTGGKSQTPTRIDTELPPDVA